MTFRPHALLAVLLLSALLTGCGTDTNTADDLGGNGFTANHFDATATPTIIEGYVIKKDLSGNLVCVDCHKSDPSDVTINRQWAESAHAGHILTVGEVQDTPAKYSAWAHYDWDSVSRQSCQQCHTATGNSAYMKAQTAATPYVAANNDFSHLDSGQQNEILYCWGCHSEVETGALLAPKNKGITINWTDGSYLIDGTAAKLPIDITLPNLGNSNACMGCHTGRGNIETLMGKGFSPNPAAALFLTDATTFSTPKPTATATSTHYMNASATIFNEATKVGYEFLPPPNYVNDEFLHDSTSCVACHMKSSSSHSLRVVTKDDTTGVITAINTQASCDSCHSVLVMNAAVLQQAADGYEQALEAFNDELTAKGYIWTPNHPYFMFDFNGDKGLDSADYRYTFTDPTTKVVSYSSTIPVGAAVIQGWKDVNSDSIINVSDCVLVSPLWPVQGDLGAAHNYNYLHHEAGAYAHNGKYARRLIFDSIDWMDNGVMNGQITIDIAYLDARTWLTANATGIANRP